jgi:hypothetical protein
MVMKTPSVKAKMGGILAQAKRGKKPMGAAKKPSSKAGGMKGMKGMKPIKVK